jgi:hypothetical protein
MKYASEGDNSLWIFEIKNPDLKDKIELYNEHDPYHLDDRTNNILSVRLVEVEDLDDYLELKFIDREDRRVSKFLLNLIEYKENINSSLKIVNRNKEVIKIIEYKLRFQEGTIKFYKDRIQNSSFNEFLGDVIIKFEKII